MEGWAGNGLYFDGKAERKVEGALVPSKCDLAKLQAPFPRSVLEKQKGREGNKEIKFINEKINFLKLAFCLKSST